MQDEKSKKAKSDGKLAGILVENALEFKKAVDNKDWKKASLLCAKKFMYRENTPENLKSSFQETGSSGSMKFKLTIENKTRELDVKPSAVFLGEIPVGEWKQCGQVVESSEGPVLKIDKALSGGTIKRISIEFEPKNKKGQYLISGYGDYPPMEKNALEIYDS